MADAYVGEIRLFAGNFAPQNWAFCNGQLLSIQPYAPLFAILGTTYGGNGTTNFALPNLQGGVPISQGQGPGLTFRTLGETGGASSVTLNTIEMASHTHLANCRTNTENNLAAPGNNVWCGLPGRPTPPSVYATAAPDVAMNATAIGKAGGQDDGQGGFKTLPHNNMSPYLSVNFIICLVGLFPPRN
jgi:microcystin-dependent protein